jgi:hypothetical protein
MLFVEYTGGSAICFIAQFSVAFASSDIVREMKYRLGDIVREMKNRFGDIVREMKNSLGENCQGNEE